MIEDSLPTKKLRGFATLTPEQRRKIASLGGKAVAAENRTFSRDKALAKAAGKKGGENIDPKLRSFAQSKTLARSAGKIGGKASHAARKSKRNDADD
jgi:general stress protein YciG